MMVAWLSRPTMHLTPFVQVDDIPFTIRPAGLLRRMGLPLQRSTNDVALEAFDYGYVLPFAFTGTIHAVTYTLRPEQLSAADRDEMQRVIAAARDTPAR